MAVESESGGSVVAPEGADQKLSFLDEIRQNLSQTRSSPIHFGSSKGSGEDGKADQPFSFRFSGKEISGDNEMLTEEGKRQFLELLGDLLSITEVLHEGRQKSLLQSERLRAINNQFSGMLRDSNKREEGNHAELRKQRSALNLWHENYLRLRDDAQGTITTLLAQRDELEKKLRQSNTEMKELVDTNEQMQKELILKGRELNRYKEFSEVYTTSEQEKQELQAEFEGILLQYSKLQAEKNSVESDRNKLQMQVDELTSKLTQKAVENVPKLNLSKINTTPQHLDEQFAADSPFPPVTAQDIEAIMGGFDVLKNDEKRMRVLELLERIKTLAETGHTYYKYTKFLMGEIDKAK